MLLFICLCLPLYAFANNRNFTPADGYSPARELDAEFRAVVDSINFKIYDAFDGSRANSDMEAFYFDMGNRLHIESKTVTIKKRLLFKKGTEVNQELLIETERRLRKEEFLADAIIEVQRKKNGHANIRITTFDQFSTIPAWNLQKPGDEWTWFLGPVESNLLGTGQKIALIYGHEVDRNIYMLQYENKAFIWNSLELSGLAAKLSDGYKYEYSLKRPLLSKQQKWGMLLSGYGYKRDIYYYLDADKPGVARKQKASASTGTTLLFFDKSDVGPALFLRYEDVVELNVSGSLTRSFGTKHKLNLSLTINWTDIYQESGTPFLINKSLQEHSQVSEDALHKFQLDNRTDFLSGIYFSYFQNQYKTVKNFRNLKWSENLDVGFRIATGIAQNVPFLGAKNSSLYLRHLLAYVNAWKSRHFILTRLSTGYFLDYSGQLEDGTLAGVCEYQWRPSAKHASYFATQWKHYFAREEASQLVLGGEQGLNGYPNRFFAGQARLLIELEQRYFPNLEMGTVAPALAMFLNAGDAYAHYQDFEALGLHYSAGFGLRLGATRSVQQTVTHLNIAFPLDPKYRDILDTWKFTLLVKGSL
ncbi:MAG: hypothetical protein HQK83_03420 [Fibrobacteria bacterium]|nr:hypothetical protein [Fibrobacteria bacterium]